MLHYILDRTAKVYGPGNGATGRLETRVINSGTMNYVDENGQATSLQLPEWMGEKKYSWLAAELYYCGELKYDAINAAGVGYKGTPVSKSVPNRSMDATHR